MTASTTRSSIRIASQIGRPMDDIIRRLSPGLDLDIVEIPRKPIASLPPDIEVLFAWPTRAAGVPDDPKPQGWPFGVRWIQLLGAGLDVYPSWLFEGPRVTNASGALAAPIAEFCMAVMLAAAKRLPETWVSAPDDWRLRNLRALEGTTLGIFGYGAIGEELGRRALAFGMTVRAARRSNAPMPPGIARAKDIGELVETSDHLVLAAPASAETRHIVSETLLARAKPGLHLVNVARGSLVDDEALLRALDSGRIALASLDVAEPEPLPAGHPFYSHPRVRLSPHTSVMSQDSDLRVARLFADNLARFARGDALRNLIC